MISKLSSIVILLCLVCFSCASSDTGHEQKLTNKKTVNLLNFDFNIDPKIYQEKENFETKLSEFSEYLEAYSTKSVESFSIGEKELFSTFKIGEFSIPNDSYVSFVLSSEKDKFDAVVVRSNFIDSDQSVEQTLNELYGNGTPIGDAESVNALKGISTQSWNINDATTVFLSQFSEGSVVPNSDGSSSKIISELIYIVRNDATIVYPNDQKEGIVERLNSRFKN